MRTHRYVFPAVLAVLAACSTPETFDFRDENRPAYEESVSAGTLEQWRNDDQVTLLDVRLLEDYQAHPVLIPGATYSDPDNIQDWSGKLPGQAKVVVYCVRGKWVSQKAANYLAGKGYEVYTLEGGIEAWEQLEKE